MIIKTAVWISIVVLWNVFVFGAYGLDKLKAVKNRWRIRESVLLVPAFFLGGIGAAGGMILFHHKSAKWLFRICIPLGLLFTIAELLFLIQFHIFLL